MSIEKVNTPDETWFHNKWRPGLAWGYLIIILFDFIGGPITTILMTGSNSWKPLTLESGGIFHISMSVILGATAWTRGQEKIQRITSLALKGKAGRDLTPPAYD